MEFYNNLSQYTSNLTRFLKDSYGPGNISYDQREDGNYRTLTGAKQLKPFIIGFIPPDQLVDFILTENIYDKFGIPSSGSENSQPSDIGRVSIAFTSGERKDGLQPKVQTNFGIEDLSALFIKILKQNGFSNNDINRLVPLMIGNINAESGGGDKPSGRFGCQNFNIGAVHASGGGSFSNPTKAPGPSPQNVPANWSKPPPLPSGGSYYLTVDSDSNSNWYPVYFRSYGSLEDAVGSWLQNTVSGWPGILNAQTPEEYAKALRPDKFPEYPGRLGSDGKESKYGYYEAPVSRYIRNVTAGAVLAQQKLGLKASPSNPAANSKPPEKGTKGPLPPPFSIMTSGGVTDLESDDPLAATPGRNIRKVLDGRKYRSNQDYLNEVKEQIKIFQSTPPLALLVNPKDFDKSFTHTIDKAKTRRTTVIHSWLEQPMTIQCSGSTAAFYAMDAAGNGGLSNLRRVRSLAYQNLMSLVKIYKNNGYIFAGPKAGSTNSGIRLIPMSIFIYYDGKIYIGSFLDFSITDSADRPHSMEYSFKFNVMYEIEANQSLLPSIR